MFFTNRDLGIEWVNPSFTAFYGYSLEEIQGRRTQDFLIGGESDSSALEDKRRDFYEKKEPVSFEILHYTKSGQKVWVAMSLQPLLDEKGGVEKVVGKITDLTERKAFERELQAAALAAERANEAFGLAP